MHVLAEGFDWLVHSTKQAPVGSSVSLNVIPFNIQVMRKSPYSDLSFRRNEEDDDNEEN